MKYRDDIQQLTEEESRELYQSGVWKQWSNEEVVRFQLFQKRLCMDFSRFHEAIEAVLGRGVYTHEFGDQLALIEEYLGEKEPPTLEEIIEMIPQDKRVLIIGKQYK